MKDGALRLVIGPKAQARWSVEPLELLCSMTAR
jgi:hypothetical protein